jgi:5,10-methylenetetrahydrofolate reductase
MRLVSASKVIIKRARTCATCEEAIPRGTECWKEIWREDSELTEHYHLRCEDRNREEYRADLVQYLANDPG